MGSRNTANIIAAVVCALVLLAGVAVISSDHGVKQPKTTTTIQKSGTPATEAVEKVVGVTRAKGKQQSTTNTRTTKLTPATGASAETTTVTGQRSFVERVLGDGGIVFLQIGAVLLAAFIAAAATQRVWMGQYGGLKAGSFELAELAESSDQTIAELKAALSTEQKAAAKDLKTVKKGLKDLRTQLATTKQDSRATDATLTEQLAFLATRLANLEADRNHR